MEALACLALIFAPRHEDPRIRVLEEVSDLASHRKEVYWNDDSSRVKDREVGGREAHPVRDEESHLLASLEPQTVQVARKGLHLPRKLGVRELLLVLDQGDLAFKVACRVPEEAG